MVFCPPGARAHAARIIFEVSIYRCGEDFLESLKSVIPDCALLDLQMPALTGRDVQRALSMQKLPLPINIVTAHDLPSLRAAPETESWWQGWDLGNT